MANQGSNTGSLHFKVLALKNYSKLYIQTTEEFWVGKWYSHICFDGHSDDYVEGKKRGGERKWKESGQVKFFFFCQKESTRSPGKRKRGWWRPCLQGCRGARDARSAATSSHRIDGASEARESGSGLTPGLLPWAAGSDGLFLLALGDARWWWVCEDKMMNLILYMSCCYTGNSWTYGKAPSRTPCNGFHTSSLPE